MNRTDIQAPKGSLLVLECIHAAYIKKEILRGVSLTVNRGEIVALLGGNGSGKSTTLKTIAGLLYPTKGRVLLDGVDISRQASHARQSMGMGYLMQGGRVFPNLTVAENFSISTAHASRSICSSQSTLGTLFPILAERASDRAGLLSGGQRQMLAIALVLAQRPKLALLDEPTGALSNDLARSILNTIVEYSRNTGCGVLLVEQNLKEAERVAHRKVTLSSGVLGEAESAARTET